MRKSIAIFALTAAFALGLGACNSNQQNKDEEAAQQVQNVPMPTNPADTAGWKKYLISMVEKNMQGVTTNHPYMYFVPAGDTDQAKADRDNQLENVKNVVARGVLPGNMLVFGGPDSAATADLAVTAFKDVQAGSFKNVVVLFIGAAADSDRVKAAIDPSGATYRFAEMK